MSRTTLTHHKLVAAASKMDWEQVVGNGGPPCFHLDPDGGRFCGRALRWGGHFDHLNYLAIHKFVSLADLLEQVKEAK